MRYGSCSRKVRVLKEDFRNKQKHFPYEGEVQLWMPQDVGDAAVELPDLKYLGQPGPGSVVEFMDTILLHHMAPNLVNITRSISAERWEGHLDDFEPQTPILARPYLPKPRAKEVEKAEELSHTPSSLLQPRQVARTRFSLPLTFRGVTCPATVLTCPDTGSDTNILSADLAQSLGYSLRKDVPAYVQLVLADGRTVSPVGSVFATFTFGLDSLKGDPAMSSIFYVLNDVPSSVIMGMPFLDQHQILSIRKNKMIKLQRSQMRAPTVFSVNKPRHHLLCELNHTLTAATPDTGSEADLMSTTFAADRGFEIHPAIEHIELADGSVVACSGFVRTTLSIGTQFDSLGFPRSKVAALIDFFLLENLTHDVIIGEHYLEELSVYTENKHSLVLVRDASTVSELNRIRLSGAIDKSLSWLKDKIGMTPASDTIQVSISQNDAIRDQRENDRRERESHRISTLPLHEQDIARQEEALKQDQYVSTATANGHGAQSQTIAFNSSLSASRVQATSTSSSSTVTTIQNISNGIELFRCNHPGCHAQPFQTQYLLNSHRTTHTEKRPHYCPVQGCSRAQGGKGFKRKDELTRHGLVHQGLGSVQRSGSSGLG